MGSNLVGLFNGRLGQPTPQTPANLPPSDSLAGLGEFQRQGATNIRITIRPAATDTPTQGPAIQVPPGAVVTLSGVNGAGVNAGIVAVANYPEQLTTNARIVQAGAEVPYPVDSCASIWFLIKSAGDGLQFNVYMPAVG